MKRRDQRDPDRLDVKSYPDAGHVFIWWAYDEGISGTLELSAKTAMELSKCLKSASLATGKIHN